MQINPSEITKILKEQIKNFGEKAEVSEVGKVLSVGDGIARIFGLDNVQAGEMVEFEDVFKALRAAKKSGNAKPMKKEEAIKYALGGYKKGTLLDEDLYKRR